ncbi:MAG TPA: GTPase HflX [Clostridiales bacterium]|nr:GTPase HflX [Clostridiales bacterium]
MELKERALLTGVNLNNDDDFEKSMDELENLAEACGFEVAGRVEQNLRSVNSAFYIGPGKVEETAALVEAMEIDAVIFDNELTPTQQRNLEKALGCRILDRTQLILEIFAQRARTREARLQVEAARLQYMLPRLAGKGVSMDRQGGGGIGTVVRGGGEKKIVLDRRRIEQNIAVLRKELEDLRKDREIQRKRRSESGLPRVALVGYTNAGKSTVMNALVELSQKPDSKKVFEKDMLFATLETSVRSIELPDSRSFLLSDTVGFVSKLPHELVKAFRSTLEEVKEADLLLHVVDASDPEAERQIRVTVDTLEQIGAGDIPVIYVFNKADLAGMAYPFEKDNAIYISAKERIGIRELAELICRYVFRTYIDCMMLIPYEYGNIVSYFRENALVKDIKYESDGTWLQLECSESDYRRYRQFVTEK